MKSLKLKSQESYARVQAKVVGYLKESVSVLTGTIPVPKLDVWKTTLLEVTFSMLYSEPRI
jgi:hypothetical protein